MSTPPAPSSASKFPKSAPPAPSNAAETAAGTAGSVTSIICTPLSSVPATIA